MGQAIAATALANAFFDAIFGASGRTTADGAGTLIVDIPAQSAMVICGRL